MTKKKNLSHAGNDQDALGRSIGAMRDVKRCLIEACIAADDIEFARDGLALALTHMNCFEAICSRNYAIKI